MKCKTCGQSLHPEQKICINCGTETDRWPGGVKAVDKPAIQIPVQTLAVIGGGLVLLIVMIIVGLSMRIVPPDQVTRKWTDACLSRRFDDAKQFTTERFESSRADRSASAERSDLYWQFRHDNNGDYAVSPPTPGGSGKAEVKLTFTGENKTTLLNTVYLVKQGKAWKIDQVLP